MDAGSKVTVRIRMLGFLAQLAKQTNLDLEIESGSTVADLVRLVAERSGPDVRRALLDWHGDLHGGVEIVLNGQHISARKISEYTLWDDSELAIIPLVGGG
jgi:molybdopterin converting factor small subunit